MSRLVPTSTRPFDGPRWTTYVGPSSLPDIPGRCVVRPLVEFVRRDQLVRDRLLEPDRTVQLKRWDQMGSEYVASTRISADPPLQSRSGQTGSRNTPRVGRHTGYRSILTTPTFQLELVPELDSTCRARMAALRERDGMAALRERNGFSRSASDVGLSRWDVVVRPTDPVPVRTAASGV